MTRFAERTHYGVIKVKALSNELKEAFFQDLFALAAKYSVRAVDGAVVEADWPIYHDTQVMIDNMRRGSEQQNAQLNRELKALRSAAIALKHDLLLRADKVDGLSVVNVSHSVWCAFKDAFTEVSDIETVTGLITSGDIPSALHVLHEKIRLLELSLESAVQQRNKSSRDWRSNFDTMHQRAMSAERRVKLLEKELAQVSSHSAPLSVLDACKA